MNLINIGFGCFLFPAFLLAEILLENGKLFTLACLGFFWGIYDIQWYKKCILHKLTEIFLKWVDVKLYCIYI